MDDRMRSEQDVGHGDPADMIDVRDRDESLKPETWLEDEPADLDSIASLSLWALPPVGIGVVAAAGHLINSLAALVVGAQLMTVFLLVVGLRLWGVSKWIPVAASALITGLLLVLAGQPRLEDGRNTSGTAPAQSLKPNSDVRGRDFDSVDLRGRPLSNLRASGATFRRARMSATQLIAADLSGADLTAADLSGTDLRGARLLGANLSNACLRGANLSGALLNGVQAVGADVTDAVLPPDALSKAASWPSEKDRSSACTSLGG